MSIFSQTMRMSTAPISSALNVSSTPKQYFPVSWLISSKYRPEHTNIAKSECRTLSSFSTMDRSWSKQQPFLVDRHLSNLRWFSCLIMVVLFWNNINNGLEQQIHAVICVWPHTQLHQSICFMNQLKIKSWNVNIIFAEKCYHFNSKSIVPSIYWHSNPTPLPQPSWHFCALHLKCIAVTHHIYSMTKKNPNKATARRMFFQSYMLPIK